MKTDTRKNKPLRCAECGLGTVRSSARAGRLAKYRTLSLPVPATLKIPTCDNCGTEWINDSTAKAIDASLGMEYHARMREVLTRALDDSDVPKAALERVLGLSQGYISHLTTTGDKTPSESLALAILTLAHDQEAFRRVESLWQKLSGLTPDLDGCVLSSQPVPI